jgi:hypothetical protein
MPNAASGDAAYNPLSMKVDGVVASLEGFVLVK